MINDVLTTVNTTDICNYNFTKNHWISNPVFSVRYFAPPPPLSLKRCLNLIIPNITPEDLLSGEFIHGRSPEFRGLYTVEFIIGILRYVA